MGVFILSENTWVYFERSFEYSQMHLHFYLRQLNTKVEHRNGHYFYGGVECGGIFSDDAAQRLCAGYIVFWIFWHFCFFPVWSRHVIIIMMKGKVR